MVGSFILCCGDGVWADEECMLGSDRRDMNAQSPVVFDSWGV